MLHSLIEYADNINLESKPGSVYRTVKWRIEINSNGRILGVVPLGDELHGKRHGERQALCPNLPSVNSGSKSHFLVETAATIVPKLSLPKKDPEKEQKKRDEKNKYYVGLIEQAAEEIPWLVALQEVLKDSESLCSALAKCDVKPNDWVGWSIDDTDLRENEEIQEWWQKYLGKSKNSSKNNKMLCLLSGQLVQPLRSHPKINGLIGVGGALSGDVIASFDKAAFRSYGLSQSANAAMDEVLVQKYTDALNNLIADKHHSKQLGNLLVVHWFKEQVRLENDPLAFLCDMTSASQIQAAATLRNDKLLRSVQSGHRVEPDNDNRFYIFTLSAVSGRVMTRDWMEGNFDELAENIEAWFNDLAIVNQNNNSTTRSPGVLVLSKALLPRKKDKDRDKDKELKDLPAFVPLTLLKIAIQRLPVPFSIMVRALRQFQMDVITGKDIRPSTLGLIKVYFIRQQQGGNKIMKSELNPDHPDPAYHCGRLLAVLAKLQRSALGDVGAGVVQRYYASASQTPGLTIGRLISNAQNHLNGLDKGLACWYDNQIAVIMNNIGSMPRTFNLEEQGLFALGYYQQLSHKENKSTDKIENQEPSNDMQPSIDFDTNQ